MNNYDSIVRQIMNKFERITGVQTLNKAIILVKYGDNTVRRLHYKVYDINNERWISHEEIHDKYEFSKGKYIYYYFELCNLFLKFYWEYLRINNVYLTEAKISIIKGKQLQVSVDSIA